MASPDRSHAAEEPLHRCAGCADAAARSARSRLVRWRRTPQQLRSRSDARKRAEVPVRAPLALLQLWESSAPRVATRAAKRRRRPRKLSGSAEGAAGQERVLSSEARKPRIATIACDVLCRSERATSGAQVAGLGRISQAPSRRLNCAAGGTRTLTAFRP